MSRAANRHKYWACPFFRWDGYADVHCGDGSKIIFPDPDTANAYMTAYCASNPGWQACSVARALYDYYDEHDEEIDYAKANAKPLE